MDGSNSLKSIQMAFITFFAQTGVGIITLSSYLSRDTGHDGWISILLGGIITCLLSVLTLILLKRYRNKAIFDINKMVFGKIIGSGFNFLLLLYLFISTVGGASLFTNFIKITILQETPSWILAPFITLPSLYLVWQGLKHMSRFLYASFINYIIILLFFILLFKSFRLSFLLPVGEAGFSKILYGLKTSFFAFTGFELIIFFYPYITDKSKALKWHITANASSMVFFLIVVILSTGIFGENMLKIISLSFYNLSRIYNAPILERVDLYLIALWFIPMACSMRCYIFAAFDGFMKVFNLKKKRSLYIIYFSSALILSSIPRNINQVFTLIDITNILSVGVAIFVIFCLIISLFRKREENGIQKD